MGATKGNLLAPRKIFGIIPFGNKMRNYFDGYKSSQSHISTILQRLGGGKDELLKDNAAIDVERQNLWAAMGRLTVEGCQPFTDLGTNVFTALGVAVGSAGAFVTFNGAGGTPTSLALANATGLTVAGGGTGRATGTTAYCLVATGTTATGAQQSLANGATTELLVGGGASALPVWTTATGTGEPVRGTTPTFKTAVLVNNPANTFAYTITPAAIAANRILNLPLLTGTDTLAVLDLAQTFTNKTLTAPKFADLGFIADANGNELVIFDTVTSAVNEVTFANAATTGTPTLTASGGDTNVGLNFAGKGTGKFKFTNSATTSSALLDLFCPSMGTANGIYMSFGVAASNYDSGSIGYVYAGSGSSGSYLSVSLYGQPVTCRFYANRIYFEEGNGIELGTTTGSKFGTGTNQKIGFWNATPIIQPTTSTTAATIVGGAGTTVKEDHTFDGYTIAKVVKALRNAGLLA